MPPSGLRKPPLETVRSVRARFGLTPIASPANR